LGAEDFAYGEGETIPYDGGKLRVVHTPGHESGHCCFYEPEQEILFTGDHILGRGTTVIPPPDGDMALYVHSLEKLLGLKLRLLLPGHGPSIQDPYGKIKEYIEHRLMREEQVLQSLREGLRTIPEIAARIYADLAAPLQSMAQLSVEAHLIKLMKEGRVSRERQNYFII
ncbi:MAG: MBL fold metallo-hydrolase, partial [Candidatus Binatia bacterium]